MASALIFRSTLFLFVAEISIIGTVRLNAVAAAHSRDYRLGKQILAVLFCKNKPCYFKRGEIKNGEIFSILIALNIVILQSIIKQLVCLSNLR